MATLTPCLPFLRWVDDSLSSAPLVETFMFFGVDFGPGSEPPEGVTPASLLMKQRIPGPGALGCQRFEQAAKLPK